MDKIKEISKWLLNQGIGISQEILDEKLQEAYKQGQLDQYFDVADATLKNILYNTIREINIRKKELYEKNFYNTPSEEDVIQMRAYEFLTENIGKIIKAYREN
jgi:isopropylmalate/homocitrate/citramalate synthase